MKLQKMADRFLNYKKAYSVYKILPFISALVTMFFLLVFGVVDVVGELTILGEDLGFVAVLLWPIIGAPLAALSAYITFITISPKVVITDATLQILTAVKQENAGASADVSFNNVELPTL